MKKKYLVLNFFGIILLSIITIKNDYIIVNNNIKNVIEEKSNICKLIEGDFSVIGSEVKCGAESFYIIESNQDIVTLFSKYNLKNNKQDSNGLNYSSTNAISFDFKDYLSTLNLGDSLKSIRLITKEELEQLGCSVSGHSCKTSEYNWLYSTNYWISSSSEDDTSNIYKVKIDGSFDYYTSDNNEEENGIRPVITILKSVINIDGGIDEKDETVTKEDINTDTIAADNLDNDITINDNSNETEDLNIGEKIFYIISVMIITFLLIEVFIKINNKNKQLKSGN